MTDVHRKPVAGNLAARDARHRPVAGNLAARRANRKAADEKPDAGGGQRRGPDWRPGGTNQDPRARFKVPRDVKRARMAQKFGWKKKKDDK